jgi:spore germination cell wall hydrolase CwlJ-like protein
MIFSPRTALLVLAALSASSVAPAQVTRTGDVPVEMSSLTLPKVAVPELLDAEPVLTDTDTNTNAPTGDATDTSQADEEPAVDRNQDLSAMVADLRGAEPGSRELECLATGIYFESKGEPLAGQLAVGEVIANRADSGRFPSTYCGVLLQRGQFSFVRGHKIPSVSHSNRQWQTAVAIAKIVDRDLKDSAASNALFFHARRVSPGWHLKRVASIGNHIFYR